MQDQLFQCLFIKMNKPLTKFCVGGLLFFTASHFALAAGNNALPADNNAQWSAWVLSQVKSLPSLQAMAKGTLVASEQRNAMQQPLYNPELGAAYTDKNDEEYSITLSQTIDWFDKRAANARLGEVDYELVSLNSVLQLENRLAEALTAYIEFSMSKQLLDVSKKQEKLLTQLSDDLKLREAAGDVGQVDAEMAYLSLSQNLQQISLIEIRHRRASANLQKALNSAQVPFRPQASIWFNEVAPDAVSQAFDNGLKVQYAKKQLEQSVSKSKIAQLNKKVNPTIGLGAGREGSENTLIFELSVPLNVRNNYSAEYSAALYKVNQTEFELQEQQRLLKNDIARSLDNYQQLKSRVLSWNRLTGNRLKNSQKLLKKQWQSGDVSTSDYLFSLRQRTDTLIANIELTGEMHKAWIEWLYASSQVQQWLKNI